MANQRTRVTAAALPGVVSLLLATALAAPGVAHAQPMPGMDMGGAQPAHAAHDARKAKPKSPRAKRPAAPAAHVPPPRLSAPSASPPRATAAAPAPPPASTTMPGMDMGEGNRPSGSNEAAMASGTMAGTGMHMMAGALGPYSMMRDSSGTAWQPDSAPMTGAAGERAGWSTMVHGYATLTYNDQGGPRGGDKTFVSSMLMVMGQRALGGGVVTLRAMGSLDALMGRRGYPLLLATGETANGRTELVDRQHPHDMIMELAGTYSHRIAAGVSGFVYLGLPGEPALGPTTYMHRFSGIANPEAPIGHHWLDSTHVTFGVATAGLVFGNLKLEASLFTGREPDRNRYDIERPRFDSWSVRAAWNPTADLSMQLSHGFLHSPEALQPDQDVRRTTASITYNRSLGGAGNWQTTLAWGRNGRSDVHGVSRGTNAFLMDSAVAVGRNTLFGRIETVAKDELFADEPANPLAGRVFDVAKASIGYYRSVPAAGTLTLDLGGLVSKYALPKAIRSTYGSHPTSFMMFARVRL